MTRPRQGLSPCPPPLTPPLVSCRRYRGLTLVLTFLCYTTYHLSRKPISIVKVSSGLAPAAGGRNVGWGSPTCLFHLFSPFFTLFLLAPPPRANCTPTARPWVRTPAMTPTAARGAAGRPSVRLTPPQSSPQSDPFEPPPPRTLLWLVRQPEVIKQCLCPVSPDRRAAAAGEEIEAARAAGRAPRAPLPATGGGFWRQGPAGGHREGKDGQDGALIFLFPDGDNYKELFGALDNAFLVAYAIGMFLRYPGPPPPPSPPRTRSTSSPGNWGEVTGETAGGLGSGAVPSPATSPGVSSFLRPGLPAAAFLGSACPCATTCQGGWC